MLVCINGRVDKNGNQWKYRTTSAGVKVRAHRGKNPQKFDNKLKKWVDIPQIIKSPIVKTN